MKKIFIAVALFLLSSGGQLAAQTITDSNTAYREFVQLAAKDGDKAMMYDALYRCYTATIAVLNNSQPTSADYGQALSNMKNLIPFLPNGAAYNSNNQSMGNALNFARAYVDVVSRPDFADGGYTTSTAYSQLSYFAAANLVNARQYKQAIPYLQAYLRSGDEKFRKSVFVNLIKACAQSNEYQLAIITLDQATTNYPDDYDIISSAVNLCIDHKDNENLQKFVTRGLALKPEDETLLNIQGKLYEDTHEFEKALLVYKKLQVTHPKALDVIKHLAINNYNIGVQNFNKDLELNGKNAAESKKLQEAFKEYFTYSIGHLKNVIISDPLSLKYTQALAVAYNCVGDKQNFEIINNKLASLGGGKIDSNFIPQLIEFSQDNTERNLASAATSSYGTQPTTESQATANADGIPAYSAFAIPYIESRINHWQQKDSYETVTEYQARVTEKNREAKIQEMQRLAQQEYISQYQSKVDLRQLELKPYDADHEAFLISSPDVGQLIVPVPRSNDEAKIFAANWNGMQFKDPKYFIDQDHLALAKLTIVTPTGKEYKYDNAAALNYTDTKVDVHFGPIDTNLLASNNNKQTISQQNVEMGNSDVDVNIPENATDNTKTFAVVIANQNYSNVASVPLALNDGTTFAKYCEKTLGMPTQNIRYYADASYGTMLRAIRDIKDIANAYNGDINIVFYYAGHGIPNEATKDAYLLPTDADGSQTEGCYSLNKLYSELGSTKAKEIVVFLDACFSGSKREEGMLASARGVALKAKKEDPRGNMVVFSAATGDETAFPYATKGHGLFTYYLLKKLQETKGDVSLGELGSYITDNVKRQSIVINHKVQTPTATPSTSMAQSWQELKLK